MLKALNHPHLPVPTGYSNAMEVTGGSRTLHIAGQVGRKQDGTIPPDITEQSKAVVANLKGLLEQAGMDFTNLVKCTVFLTDEALLPEFVSIWYPALPSPPPAVTGVIVKALVHPSLLVEVDAIAVA